MKKKKKKRGYLITLIVLGVLACVFLVMLQPIGDYLIVLDDLQKADMIATVSGPEYRILYAVELYKKGLGTTLFYTGGYSEKNERIEASWSERIAIENGVPEEHIVIDGTAVYTTYDEAELLKRYIETYAPDTQSVIVVTDPYHSRRAKWIYQLVMGESIQVSVAPVPRSQTGFPKHWWTTAESRRIVAKEYLKLIFYHLRYDMTSGPLKSWLSQFDKF